MNVTGKITKLLDTQSGKSAKGEWKKTSFILETNEKYNNTYCFEVFGVEQVDTFLKYNKKGSDVKVDFNVRCQEYQGKYYTSLQAWKVFKAETVDSNSQSPDRELVTEDDLPF
jgi:hypothetical protein